MNEQAPDSEPVQPNAHRATSAGGGIAGKLGDRYEARWTVLRGVLPVLRGEFAALIVEDPESAQAKVEFRLTGGTNGAPDEGHQCKRTHSTSWTVKALKGEGFIQAAADMADAGKRVVFVSSKSSVLETMIEKAERFSDTAAWVKDLNGDEELSALSQLEAEWRDTAEVHRRLVNIAIEQISDKTLGYTLRAQLADAITGDADAVFGVLRGYIEDRFGQPMTANDIWAFLREKGREPAKGFNAAMSERVREATQTYVENVLEAAPEAMRSLSRPELGQIIQRLRDLEDQSVLVITGRPGAGKSFIAAGICQALGSTGVTVGVLRLDLAQPAATAVELGSQPAMRFGGSPAEVLARASGSKAAVLIIDQAEAASLLSGRGHAVVEALRDTLRGARATPAMKVLVTCRTEDLRFDGQLRSILGIEDPAQPSDSLFALGDLGADEVDQVISAVGMSSSVPAPLRRLMANPFNLSLFVQICATPKEARLRALASVRTRLDLLRAYDLHVAARVRRTLGPNVFTHTMFRLADEMSRRGTLSVPRSFMAADADTVDALVHEGVLVHEGPRLRFFHEALFDYYAAAALRSRGTSVTDLLAAGPQELLRRGQVRAVLALDRDEGISTTYLSDLAGTANRGVARSHIRAAVFSQLGEADDLHDDEAQILLNIAIDPQDPLQLRAQDGLTVPSVAAYLAGTAGLLNAAAAVIAGATQPSDDKTTAIARLGAQTCATLLTRAAAHEPEAAALAATTVCSDLGLAIQYSATFLHLIHRAGNKATGSALGDLYLALTRAFTALALDDERLREASADAAHRAAMDVVTYRHRTCAWFVRESQFALLTISQRTPLESPRAIRGWLDVAVTLDRQRGASALFGVGSVLDGPATGLPGFALAAERTPRQFLEFVLPVFVDDWQRASWTLSWLPTASGLSDGLRDIGVSPVPTQNTLEHEVTEALNRAAELAGQAEPERLVDLTAALGDTDLLPVHMLLSRVYATAGEPLLANACDWFCQPRVRGLPREATPGWAWGAVAARIMSAGSPAQRSRVSARLRDAYGGITEADPSLRLHLEREELQVLALVADAAPDVIPTDLRDRLEHLQRTHGPASPKVETFHGLRSRSTDIAVSEGLADEQWTAMVIAESERLAAAEPDPFEPRLWALNTGLAEAIKMEPSRFARLAATWPDTTPSAIIAPVLRNLAEHGTSLSIDGVAAAVALIRTCLQQPPSQETDGAILNLIVGIATHELPADIVAAVVAIYDRNPHPEPWAPTDLETAGLNHPSGFAVYAAGALLNHPPAVQVRLDQLGPLLDQAVESVHAPVRVWMPMVLAVLHPSLPDEAAAFATRWIDHATDRELTASFLDRLTWQLALTAPATAGTLLARMGRSADPGGRQRAGQLAVLFEVDDIVLHTPSGHQTALAAALADDDGRAGVAEALAHRVNDLPSARYREPGHVLMPSQRLLVQLADDETDRVRQVVMDVGRHLDITVAGLNELLKELTQSAAFRAHPGALVLFLTKHVDELPPAALDICEAWAAAFAERATDTATHEAGAAYQIVAIVLALYTNALPNSAIRKRCLDLIDRFVELRIGDVENKADEAIHDPLR
ncbi:hypothetical protein ABZS66_00015 [Dactylosporangium sp. NPDC005572]|uniref:hypothetical protein n=1 Tax=Dactylosporangium sp. NPDC005572 TaxID=3156889 RepID=UPI00339FE185